MKKKIVILGSSGSIGKNAVRVAQTLSDRFEVVGLAVNTSVKCLAEQAALLKCPNLAVADERALAELRRIAPAGCNCTAGAEALIDMVTRPEVDTVLCAIVGTGGLLPVLAALRADKTVALASKEVLVMAGELVNAELAAGHGRIIPVDSEHSAIYQCLNGRSRSEVRRLIITASGGAFRDWPQDKLVQATYQDALAHPVWDMGPKITVDSATLMNKALEIIEAGYLFNMPPETIDVVIHPQSLVHSMIELADGAVLAQMSVPDMRFAIQYALSYPERLNGDLPRLKWQDWSKLEFREPDIQRLPSLAMAYQALESRGTMGAVLNAANEVAVEAFSCGRITLPGIWKCVQAVMDIHTVQPQTDLETILEADRWARKAAAKFVDIKN